MILQGFIYVKLTVGCVSFVKFSFYNVRTKEGSMNMNFDYPLKTRTDFLKEVVALLVQRRLQLGITQDELNHMLGVADRLVSKWECGVRTPSSFHLYCWADALESQMTIVANDNNLPTPEGTIEKAVNDNTLFKVECD